MTPHLLIAAALLGAMLFFAAIVAPSVFRFLEGEAAQRFLRGIFPRYYVAGLAVALLAAAAAGAADDWAAAGLLAAVAGGFGVSRWGLVDRINAARDADLTGDAAAGARFKALHRASVLINLAQMLALLALIVAGALGA
ncbi:MAG: DUF4149 domain-containing protein [Alphaproteobacteria bacterium]|nr:DUF4149 domain-containing protein [Alphaproteobacteria bacterium]